MFQNLGTKIHLRQNFGITSYFIKLNLILPNKAMKCKAKRKKYVEKLKYNIVKFGAIA